MQIKQASAQHQIIQIQNAWVSFVFSAMLLHSTVRYHRTTCLEKLEKLGKRMCGAGSAAVCKWRGLRKI